MWQGHGMRTLRRLLAITIAATLAAVLAPHNATATPSSYPGMAGYPTYNKHFWDGPSIGHLGNYVPQGLTYWKAKDALIITYYDDDNTASPTLLSVRNRLGKKTERKWLKMFPGHAGGAVISGKYLWVSSTDTNNQSWVYRYSLAKFATAKNKSYLPFDKPFKVAAASYVTVRGGDLWVGKHTTSDTTAGTMYRYDITSRGNLRYLASMSTPGRVQGASFSGNKVIFSRSWTRKKASTITVKNLTTGRQKSFSAPSMTQGSTLADGWYYLLTESGASKYKNTEDGTGKSINPITKVHYASLTWLKSLP